MAKESKSEEAAFIKKAMKEALHMVLSDGVRHFGDSKSPCITHCGKYTGKRLPVQGVHDTWYPYEMSKH